MAQTLVQTVALGPVAPFDAAATVLTIGGLIILTTWPENYGDTSGNTSTIEGFKKAAKLIASGEHCGSGGRALHRAAPAPAMRSHEEP